MTLRNLMPVSGDQPLGRPAEVRRMILELPVDNSLLCLETYCNWLESLSAAQDLSPEVVLEVCSLIDEAGQVHLSKLTRYYLQSSRLSKNEENSLYTLAQNYLRPLTNVYEWLQNEFARRQLFTDPQRALLVGRLVQNLGRLLKWEDFRYSPTLGNVWLRLGYSYLLADAWGFAGKEVMLYPSAPVLTNVHREYLRVLVVQTTALDSLLPVEIDWADQLVAAFIHLFSLTAKPEADSLYWVDPSRPVPPVRLNQMPGASEDPLRFFKPGPAFNQLQALKKILEAQGKIPDQLKLEGNPSPRALLRVVRHLAAAWGPELPARSFERHKVKHRATVLHGLVNIFMAFSGDLVRREPTVEKESWVVQNVSQGGFGAIVTQSHGEWIKLGCLIAMQPRGGDNWLLCAIRRYHRYSDTGAAVGIQTLGRRVSAVDLVPHATAKAYSGEGMPALCIEDGIDPGQVRLVMPPGKSDPRQPLIMRRETRRYLMEPMALVTRESDYEIVRYRAKALD